LLPDDNGNMSGFAFVIANFQLDAADDEASLAGGNGLLPFLDCIIKLAEKEDENDKSQKTNNQPGF